ncbi:GFA family protein [Natronospirillum operosum]|uniref:GFA family protein n=1 Tax=Natronospirillum operosum TaxID=2759953 RepID=A0A4Z0WJW2_9GAMM|nr:GFA family protein [Natronospirillum operosum]TGG95455.1 GFA family protein [Natronospirillum operosum]
MTSIFPIEGGCDCGAVRYRMLTEPLVVHCCHCRWCQRETGASFGLNAMIESDRVVNLGAEPELVQTPSNSGLGQRIARCSICKVAVWSHYAGSGHLTKFVRVGTLDDPDALPPDVHIFTASKQPWVTLPSNARSYSEFYDRKDVWRQDSIDRFEALRLQIAAYQASLKGPQA